MNRSSQQSFAQERPEGALAAYLAAIRAHPVIVAMVMLACVGASVAFLMVRSSRYEATADLLVNAVPQEDQVYVGLPLIRDSGDPVRTVQTAASLIESREAAALAAQRLGGDWTADELLDAVEIAPRGESNVLGLSARAASAEEAAQVANEFSRATLDVRNEAIVSQARPRVDQLDARLRELPAGDAARTQIGAEREQLQLLVTNGDPTLTLAQEAIPPESAIGASPPLIVLLALLAGFVLGSGAALLLELTTRRIRDEDEALRLFPLPALARVPLLPARSRRGPSGATWYMPPEITEPFRTLAVQLEQRDRASEAIMVTSPTTGDGKTTSAINLAVSLAATGKQVVLLDFDLRKPQVANVLGMTEGRRLGDLVDNKSSLTRLLVRPAELPTLRVLPVSFDPRDAHHGEAASRSLPQLIQQARGLADYVVVDTPPLGEVSDALRLTRAVDDILVVIRPGNTNRGHLGVTRELLERSGYEPTGCIIIGAAERPGRGYRGYGYGYGFGGAPELVLGDVNSPPAGAPPAPATPPSEPRVRTDGN